MPTFIPEGWIEEQECFCWPFDPHVCNRGARVTSIEEVFAVGRVRARKAAEAKVRNLEKIFGTAVARGKVL